MAGTLARKVRDFWALGPFSDAHMPAVHTALAMAIALGGLLSIGHLGWSVYATFGVMCAAYGRGLAPKPNFLVQLVGGLSLSATVVLGAVLGLMPDRELAFVIVAPVWAGIITLVGIRVQWRPAGALFHMFGLGAVAAVPSSPHLVAVSAAVSIAATAMTLVLGAILVRVIPRRTVHPDPELPTVLGVLRDRAAWRLAATYVLVSAVAGLIAHSLGLGHVSWAVLTAVAPLSASGHGSRLLRGTQRLVGTMAGLGVTWLFFAMHPGEVATVIAVIVLQGVTELIVVRNYAWAMLTVTPMALSMIALAVPNDPMTLVTDRAVETVVGTLSAFAIIVVSVWWARLAAHERR